jgi:hypothetical protein
MIQAKNVAADFERGIHYLFLLITLVTGKKARFELVPKDTYVQSVGQYLGTFIAVELWEMFNYFADLGFGTAGEPEVLDNTKKVRFKFYFRTSYMGSSVFTLTHGSIT